MLKALNYDTGMKYGSDCKSQQLHMESSICWSFIDDGHDKPKNDQLYNLLQNQLRMSFQEREPMHAHPRVTASASKFSINK